MEPPRTGAGDPHRRGPGGRSQGSHRTSDIVSRGPGWTAAGIQFPDVAAGRVFPWKNRKGLLARFPSVVERGGGGEARGGGDGEGARPAPGLSGLRLAESLGLQFPQFLLSAPWAAGRCRTEVLPFPLTGIKGVWAAQQRRRPVFGQEAGSKSERGSPSAGCLGNRSSRLKKLRGCGSAACFPGSSHGLLANRPVPAAEGCCGRRERPARALALWVRHRHTNTPKVPLRNGGTPAEPGAGARAAPGEKRQIGKLLINKKNFFQCWEDRNKIK